jgi:hypothetical protein
MTKGIPKIAVFIPASGIVGWPLPPFVGLCRDILLGTPNRGRLTRQSVQKQTEETVITPSYAFSRLFTLRYGGDELNRTDEPDNSSSEHAADEMKFGFGRFGRFGRFTGRFEKCDFSKENGKTFGLDGLARFLLEGRKPNGGDSGQFCQLEECGALPRRHYARKSSQTRIYKGLRLIDRSHVFP